MLKATKKIRHRASTSMYSLTFCVCFLLPERHQWKPAVQTAAVMLRTPPVGGRPPAVPASRMQRTVLGAPHVARRSPAGGARRPRPAGHSHYVVISQDGCKLVTRVRVMLPQQCNLCPDCKSAQQCTTRLVGWLGFNGTFNTEQVISCLQVCRYILQ